jgi:hypothetical protein
MVLPEYKGPTRLDGLDLGESVELYLQRANGTGDSGSEPESRVRARTRIPLGYHKDTTRLFLSSFSFTALSACLVDGGRGLRSVCRVRTLMRPLADSGTCCSLKPKTGGLSGSRPRAALLSAGRRRPNSARRCAVRGLDAGCSSPWPPGGRRPCLVPADVAARAAARGGRAAARPPRGHQPPPPTHPAGTLPAACLPARSVAWHARSA